MPHVSNAQIDEPPFWRDDVRQARASARNRLCVTASWGDALFELDGAGAILLAGAASWARAVNALRKVSHRRAVKDTRLTCAG